MNPLSNLPPITKNIILINIVVFIAQNFIPNFTQNFALHFYASPDFKPYQLLTHMFMHGSISHIFFNMFALFMFGAALEYRMGPKRYFTYYLLTGFGAVMLHFASMYWESYSTLMEIQQYVAQGQLTPEQISNAYFNTFHVTLGASGALFGVLAGFAMLYPNQELFLMFIPIPIKAKYFVLGYAAIELFLGVSGSSNDNIAHFAHLGGALFGFIIIKEWQRKRLI